MDYITQPQPKLKTEEEIQAFLAEKIALIMRTSPEEINIHDDLAIYGLDSLDAMTIMGRLSERCGYNIDFDVVWDYSSIAALAEYVAAEIAAHNDAQAG